jgi:hypothetical protein
MDTPNLELRESGSCATDGEADSKNPALKQSGVFLGSCDFLLFPILELPFESE